MKKYLCILILTVLTQTVASCGDDDDMPSVRPTSSGTVKDSVGNEYKWVRIGSLDWMAENLKCGTPYYEQKSEDKWGDYGLTFYITSMADAQQTYKTFGNYFSYQEALDNCPSGWRLPTDEDWKKLEKALGMSEDEANKTGWRDGAGLLLAQTADEGTGLSMRYGGELCVYSYSDLGLYHVYDYGMYWSATKDTTSIEEAVYIRKITPNQNKVQRITALTEKRWLSVRYVRDAQ